jgi:phospholipase C
MVLQTNNMTYLEISDWLSLTLGRFVETSFGFRGHSITNFPHIMVLLIINDSFLNYLYGFYGYCQVTSGIDTWCLYQYIGNLCYLHFTTYS